MLKKFIRLLPLLAFMLLLSACSGEYKEPYEPLTPERIEKLHHDHSSFMEQVLSYRVYTLNSFDWMKDHDPLTGDDHERIEKLLLNHLSIKDRLDYTIGKYQYLLKESNGYTEKERLELLMISLSAMLVRYDDYLLAYSNYENHDKLRVRLNEEGDHIPKNTLLDITKTYHDLGDRQDVKEMIDFYKERIGAYEEEKELLFVYLKSLIEQSASYQLGFDDDKEYGLDALRTLYTHTLDLLELGGSTLTNEFSKGFGNSAGLVETRKGKLYDNDAITEHISSNLRAGDILLEKTPFRLTDKLIPGHWGHAAVYIGTVDELKELGLWEHEAVKPYHAQLEEGKLIVEALRDGVQLNSVAHFLNVDDFATMRDTQASDEVRKARIIRNFKQLGKDYDFNFDIETADKIVCSELVYITFTEVTWETEKVAGTHTISPDNVAKKSIEEPTDFAVTLLYHDGSEITEDKKNEMKKLLENS